MITTVLRVFVYGLFIRADLPVFPFVLFGSCLNGIFIVFGIVRSIIFSCACIAVFSTAWFRAALLTSVLWLYLRRFILGWVLLIVAIVFFGCIHHVYVMW